MSMIINIIMRGSKQRETRSTGGAMPMDPCVTNRHALAVEPPAARAASARSLPRHHDTALDRASHGGATRANNTWPKKLEPIREHTTSAELPQRGSAAVQHFTPLSCTRLSLGTRPAGAPTSPPDGGRKQPGGAEYRALAPWCAGWCPARERPRPASSLMSDHRRRGCA